MLRRSAIAPSTLLLLSCAGQNAGPDRLLQPDVAGWHRTAMREIGAGAADPHPSSGSVRRTVEANYEGPGAEAGAPGRLKVDVFQMSSPGGALEAVQHFRPTGDQVSIYRDELFIVVHLSNADRRATHAFIQALEAPPVRKRQ